MYQAYISHHCAIIRKVAQHGHVCFPPVALHLYLASVTVASSPACRCTAVSSPPTSALLPAPPYTPSSATPWSVALDCSSKISQVVAAHEASLVAAAAAVTFRYFFRQFSFFRPKRGGAKVGRTRGNQ